MPEPAPVVDEEEEAEEAEGGAALVPGEPVGQSAHSAAAANTTVGARVRRLAVGWSHACALTAEGEAICGGWDWNKEAPGCTSGGFIEGRFEPPAGAFAHLDAEAYATCGLEKGSGSLSCWGEHYVADAFSDIEQALQVSVSVSYGCALLPSDEVVCGSHGVVSDLSGLGAVDIAMGHDHVCALLPSGGIDCVHFVPGGERDFGQADAPDGAFVFLTAGYATSCAIDALGVLRCWGRDDDGQATPPPGAFVWADVGLEHGCAVQTDGAVACWGANDNGESSPPPGQFREVGVGYGFSCGLRVDESVTCWGSVQCANTALPAEL